MQDKRWPTYATRQLVIDRAVPRDDGRGSFHVRDSEGREYLDAVGEDGDWIMGMEPSDEGMDVTGYG